MVIAAVFDGETDHAVQTASALPTGGSNGQISSQSTSQHSTPLFLQILQRLVNIR